MLNKLIPAAALTAALFSSCTQPASMPYTGNYSGTFTVSDGSSGTLSASVDGSGNLSGTIRLASPAAQTSVSGTVQNDGTTSAKYQYSGGSFPQVTLTGKLTLNGNVASGTLNASTATVANGGTVTVSLTKQ